jgi:hypothetical protein
MRRLVLRLAVAAILLLLAIPAGFWWTEQVQKWRAVRDDNDERVRLPSDISVTEVSLSGHDLRYALQMMVWRFTIEVPQNSTAKVVWVAQKSDGKLVNIWGGIPIRRMPTGIIEPTDCLIAISSSPVGQSIYEAEKVTCFVSVKSETSSMVLGQKAGKDFLNPFRSLEPVNGSPVVVGQRVPQFFKREAVIANSAPKADAAFIPLIEVGEHDRVANSRVAVVLIVTDDMQEPK